MLNDQLLSDDIDQMSSPNSTTFPVLPANPSGPFVIRLSMLSKSSGESACKSLALKALNWDDRGWSWSEYRALGKQLWWQSSEWPADAAMRRFYRDLQERVVCGRTVMPRLDSGCRQ